KPLQDYDCIITDMQMEHAESGLELVEKAIREGKLPWVATGGTYEHGGTFNRDHIFNSHTSNFFDRCSKSEPGFWEQALVYIEKNQDNATRKALEKVHDILGMISEYSTMMLMQYYRNNNQK